MAKIFKQAGVQLMLVTAEKMYKVLHKRCVSDERKDNVSEEEVEKYLQKYDQMLQDIKDACDNKEYEEALRIFREFKALHFSITKLHKL